MISRSTLSGWLGFLALLFFTATSATAQTTHTVCASGCDFTTIQTAVAAAAAGDIVDVAAGTYSGLPQVTIDKALTLRGAGSGSTTIDVTGAASYGISTNASDVTLEGFTVSGEGASYNVKISGLQSGPLPYAQATNVVVNDVVVTGSKRSGIDVNGTVGITITDVSVSGTVSGNGIGLTDVSDATLTNVTTSGNAWGGVAIYTYGRYYALGSDNISLSNVSGDEGNPVYVQIANYNDPGNPEPVTNLSIPTAEYPYQVLNAAHRSGGEAFTFYNPTLISATDLAVALNNSATPSTASTIEDRATGNFQVTQNGSGALSLQAAIDGAPAAGTVEVQAGTYTENVIVAKNLSVIGDGRATTALTGVSGAGALGTFVVQGTTAGVRIEGMTITGIDNGAPGIENAAVYIKGSHSGLEVRDNEIVAAGDAGLIAEYGATVTGATVDGNIFSGSTFVGPNPAGNGFSQQFTLANVPRQLVVFGNGGGTVASALVTNLTFTNNEIVGVAGGLNGTGDEQGNTLATLDAANSTITGNTFSGTTTRFGAALRVRRDGTTISSNGFTSTGMGLGTEHLFIQNNSTAVQDIVAANTFDRAAYHDNGSDVSVSVGGGVSRAPVGGTAHVLPGLYVEQVVVSNKEVSIQGAGSGSTTIQAPASMAACFATSTDIYPVVCAKDDAELRIDDITIDGAGRGNGHYRYVGIGYLNAAGHFNDGSVIGVRETPINGNQHGLAVYVGSDDSAPRTFELTNSTIDDFQKGAVSFFGDGLTADVDGNTITGAGAIAFTAQNGIQVGFGASATITNNDVSGFSYTPSSTVATGLLLYLPGSVTATGNTVDESEIGIYGYGGTLNISGNTVTQTTAGLGGVADYTGIYGITEATASLAPGSEARAGMASALPVVEPVSEKGGRGDERTQSSASFGPGNVTMDGNTVTGDSGAGSSGLAVYATATGTVSMAGNTASGYDVGIYFGEANANDLTSVTASGNDLSGNTIAIQNDAAVTAIAEGNFFGDADPTDDIAGAMDYSPWLGSAPGTSPQTVYTNDSINDAIALASAGDTVEVLAGTYAETVNVDKQLSLNGAGDGTDAGSNTIISGAGSGNGLTMTAGANASARTVASGLRVTGFTHGIIPSSFTTLSGVTSEGNVTSGTNLSGVNDLVIEDSHFEGNSVGLRVGTAASVDGLTITNSAFDNNNQGWFVAASSSTASVFTNISVTGSSFSGNTIKGIYIEKLSNAVFDDITVANSGTDASYASNAGIDVNLKYGAYSNITLQNSSITGSGVYGTASNPLAPVGVAIKARDDAPSYSANPASLSNVTLANVTIDAPENALLFGEPGKNNVGATNAVVQQSSLFAAETTGGTGYGLNNQSQTQVDARYNSWGDASGPSGGLSDPLSSTLASGSGSEVSALVRFDPWIGKAQSQPVTAVNTPIEFDADGDTDTDVTMTFSTLPPGGGDISVAFVPGTPTPTPPGAPLALYLDITSTMPNYSFDVVVVVDVSGIAGFDANTQLAYYNGSEYVLIPGTYDGGAETFTFTTNHFTPFVFFAPASTPFNLFTSATADAATAGTIYPNDAWATTSNEPNDWRIAGSTVEVYLVPEESASFGAADVTLTWDEDILTYVSAEKTGGLFDNGNSVFQSLSSSASSVRINASRLDNTNLTVASVAGGDQYIAKLTFTVAAPGFSPLDITSMSFRAYDGVGGQSTVLGIANAGGVKAYLGDVAASGDASTGDGEVDFEDLVLFTGAYWSNAAAAPTNYKVKYDVGPTSTNNVFGNPTEDGEIEFEDLVIFSISYGLSTSDVYPLWQESPPVVVANKAATAETVEIRAEAARVVGSNLHIPIHTGSVDDLRAFSIEAALNGSFEVIGAARASGGIIPSDSPALVVARETEQGGAILDASVLSLDGLAGQGAMVELVLRPTSGSASAYDGRKDLVQLTSAKLRSSLNTEIPVELGITVQTEAGAPAELSLSQSVPNPTTGTASIGYAIPEAGRVDLVVYDALGRSVATLVESDLAAGYHTATFNADALPSGTYIYVLRAGGQALTGRMMVVR